MTTKTVVAELAMMIDAFHRCQEDGNPWLDKWEARIGVLMDSAPSGSGVDTGTQLDLEKSHGNKLVLQADYHHMDEWGHYDGWTEHTIRVYPHLYLGLRLKISGPNRNDIKKYLHQTYDMWLQSEVEKGA